MTCEQAGSGNTRKRLHLGTRYHSQRARTERYGGIQRDTDDPRRRRRGFAYGQFSGRAAQTEGLAQGVGAHRTDGGLATAQASAPADDPGRWIGTGSLGAGGRLATTSTSPATHALYISAKYAVPRGFNLEGIHRNHHVRLHVRKGTKTRSAGSVKPIGLHSLLSHRKSHSWT